MGLKERKAVLEELVKRTGKDTFELEDVCFGKQIDFILDKNKLKTAVCGRRAGKTHACAVYLLYTALSRAGSTSVYITLTRANAKRIIWPTLIELNYQYKLAGIFNE